MDWRCGLNGRALLCTWEVQTGVQTPVPPQKQDKTKKLSIKKEKKKAWGMAQVVEHLTSKYEAVSSNPGTDTHTHTHTKKEGRKGRKEGKEGRKERKEGRKGRTEGRKQGRKGRKWQME
jgi:hypothetical protein